MKKTTLTLLAAALSLSLLASCASENSPEHTHTTSAWDCNASEHWHVCDDCGEKTDVAAHTLVDDYLCNICSSEIWDFGDGTYDVTVYDEHGNTIKSTYYNADGTAETEYRYEYTYDADGNIAEEIFYVNGTMSSKYYYNQTVDGDMLYTKTIEYYEDGSTSTCEYDEFGDTVSLIYTDENNNIYSEEYYEYSVDYDGERYASKTTHRNHENSIIYISEENEYGDTVSIIQTDFDSTVLDSIRYEYTYDEDGRITYMKEYQNNVLIEERLDYKIIETDDYTMRFPATVINYNEDGSKSVSINGDYGEPVSVTNYDSEGIVTGSTEYTYKVDENDIIYVSVMIEYNANGDILSEVHYDSEGNEIK